MRIIAGRFRNQALISPKTKVVRPTLSQVRAAVFNICQQDIEEALFLDLFAGSGAMGLEALSRGAKSSTFIEQDPIAFRCLKQNIEKLKVMDECVLHGGDAIQFLERFAKKGLTFSLIYIDPPYAKKGLWKDTMIPLGEKAMRIIDAKKLLQPGGSVFFETGTTGPLIDLENLSFKNERRFASSYLQLYQN
ncbi:MAG: 16S rRNA (guanine(966)-N(2))-methyltransferase RsmD [Parachlamydiales bacterium]|nr:16S rRNA (guanine(966)-N(2))-methyltransferase RsmD [Parachlamydiales bacterium]